MLKIYHKLGGIPGWSHLSPLSVIDVSKIGRIYSAGGEMFYDKRAFMIKDRDYPYTLSICYIQKEAQFLTRRFKTEKDVLQEISDIRQKQENFYREIKK